LIFSIPAALDFFGTTLAYIGLNFISPSIYTMIRGGLAVVTAIGSVIFLKVKLRINQIFGCGLVVLGIFIVGISGFVFGNSESNYSVQV